MSIYAAVVTSKAKAAIASIELVGDGAKSIIDSVFKPSGSKKLKPHSYSHGLIIREDLILDDVLVGCTSEENYTIHCHGNPLILKEILNYLHDHNVEIVDGQQLTVEKARRILQNDAITIEAMAYHPKARNFSGVKIIMHQPKSGLKKWAAQALTSLNKISITRLRQDSITILENTKIAKMHINGFRVVITGPPNSGKSTLINAIAGRTKAIVSQQEGTTRDWVSIKCRIKNFHAEFIDTAGLDPYLAAGGHIDKQSQEIAKQMLESADLILLLLDGTQSPEQWFQHQALWQSIITNKTPVLSVLNKSDISKTHTGGLWISAKNNQGIENIIEKIIQTLKLHDIEMTKPACFTSRQENIINNLSKERSKQNAKTMLTELLFKLEPENEQ